MAFDPGICKSANAWAPAEGPWEYPVGHFGSEQHFGSPVAWFWIHAPSLSSYVHYFGQVLSLSVRQGPHPQCKQQYLSVTPVVGINGRMHAVHLEEGLAPWNRDRQVTWKDKGIEAHQLVFAIYWLCDFGGYHELSNPHLHLESGDTNPHRQALLESNVSKEWRWWQHVYCVLSAGCPLRPCRLWSSLRLRVLWPPDSSVLHNSHNASHGPANELPKCMLLVSRRRLCPDCLFSSRGSSPIPAGAGVMLWSQ